MIYLDILHDEVLQEALNKVISGALPTEKYDSKYYGECISGILKYIKLEEFSAEYYCLLSALIQFRNLAQSMTYYRPMVTRTALLEKLTTSAVDLVKRPEVKMEELLLENGLNTNLNIDINLEAACNLLIQRTLDLYDKCFELGIGGETALSFLPALEEAFLYHVNDETIKIRALMRHESIRIGKKVYTGARDSMQYEKIVQQEIDSRLIASDDNIEAVTSAAQGQALIESARESKIPIAPYGLPLIDDETPMLRHRLAVVCANENVGKTQFVRNCIGNLLLENRKILLMFGESRKDEFWVEILSTYIYKKYKTFILSSMITKPEDLPPDKAKLISVANAEIANRKNIILMEYVSYDAFYDTLYQLYEIHHYDAAFIDHSLALIGDGDQYSNLNKLAVQARMLKKKLPIFLCITSHLSVTAKDLLTKGKRVDQSPTKGSSTLAAEADEIFILNKNEILDKQGILAIYCYKRRKAAAVTEPMLVRKYFQVGAFEWDETIQGSATGMDVSAESILLDIENTYGEGTESSGDDWDDDGFYDDEDENDDDYDE